MRQNLQSTKLEFENAAGHSLAGRLELPAAEPRAFALFAHCFTCSKDIAAATRISRALAQRGIAVLRFDFTGLGNSEGDFGSTDFSSNIDDLIAAATHLREHHRAPSLLIGHSLGGAAVLRAAPRVPEVRAVATIGAPKEPRHVTHLLVDRLDEIEERGSARVELAGRQFKIGRGFVRDLETHDGLDDLRRAGLATLICHSPSDEIVPVDEAAKIYGALRHPKSFVSLADADHLLTRREDSEYVATVLAAWASRYLEPAAAVARPVVTEGLRAETGRTGFRTELMVGEHTFLADEPRKFGGTDTAPTPYGLLLGALAACTTMTLQMYARRKQWPLERAIAHVRHSRVHAEDCSDCETEGGKIERFERELELVGALDDEQRQRLLEIADRCPVHRTLMHDKQIVTTLRS
ncbi:MAG: alpha/beta fold hydrolase [bacterium]|nr:alpha/beta fold hydrolase [bacterium]